MRSFLGLFLLCATGARAGIDPSLTRALLDEDAPAARTAWDRITPEDRKDLAPYGGELAVARILAMEGNVREAIALYETLARDEAWRDVAFFEMAAVARQSHDAAHEIEALQGLLTVARDHPDLDAMKLRLGRLLAEKGDRQRALAVLVPLETIRSRRVRRDATCAEILLRLGEPQSYETLSKRFDALVDEDDADDAALRTTTAIVEIEAKNGATLSPEAERTRGLVFYKNREWDRAIHHLAIAADLSRATPEGFKPDPTAAERGARRKRKPKAARKTTRPARPAKGELDRAETVFYLARIYFRKGDYASAAATFDAASSLSTSGSLGASASFQRAVCLERLGHADAALEILSGLQKAFPGGDMQRHALGRRVGILRVLGRLDEARALLSEARNGTKDAAYRAELWWTEARIEMLANPARALTILDEFSALVGEDGNRARLMREGLLDARETAERASLLSRVLLEDPSGFFGEVARTRLAPLSLPTPVADPALVISSEATKPPALLQAKDRLLALWCLNPSAFRDSGLPILRGVYGRLGRYKNVADFAPLDLRSVDASSPRYSRLLAAGLAHEACFAMMEDGDSPNLGPMARAIVFALGGQWNRALAVAQAKAGAFPRDVVAEAYPVGLDRLLYPLPRSLVKAAAEAKIPFALAAAITREESAYRPDARSPAGAYGLMQVVPDTAAAIAQARRTRGEAVPDPDGDNLYDVQTGFFYGTRYLAELSERFGGALAPVIASYNAGPDAADEWKRRSGSDLLAFEGEIAFAETKQYVRRVYLSYLRYQTFYPTLHGEDPPPMWPDLLALPETP